MVKTDDNKIFRDIISNKNNKIIKNFSKFKMLENIKFKV